MKALVYHGPEDIRCDTVVDPDPYGVDGAVLEVTAAGICGSDLHIYDGHGFAPDAGYTVGHEAVGRVVEVGSGVRSVAVGDRVMVAGSAGCGVCPACHGHDLFDCVEGGVGVFGIGLGLPGCQAEGLAVPGADGNLVKIPEAISDDQAIMLTDNLPTGWFGAQRADIAPGSTVAVIGLGPVGQMAVEAAMVMGAGRVLAIDLVPERLAAAAAIGAEPIIGGSDVVARVAEMTAGRRCDSVIEAIGLDDTVRLALDICRPQGTVSVVGVNQSMDFAFPMALAMAQNLTFRIGLCIVQATWPQLVPLVAAGRLRPERVITDRPRLDEGSEAYARFAMRTDGVMKMVLDT